MMYIIETCPQCGSNLEILTLTMNPPIPARRCKKCGWYWQGKAEMPMYVPFHPIEEVYSINADTVGNFHWTGTYSGEHIVKAEEG